MENNYTVDNLYSTKLNQFENKEFLNIQKYKNKINELILKRKDDNITEIDNKIKSLQYKIFKNENKINNYFLENSNDLCNYFSIKQNIENNKNPKKMIHNFFNKDKGDELSNNTKYIESTNIYMKKNNFKIYIENLYNKDFVTNICNKCNVGELIKSSYDGILICNKCYSINKYLINSDKPSYKEPPKEISFYAYRRINHFKEILAQFQAKETTDIPDSIIEKIKYQIKKERIDIKYLTNKKTKDILKKLGFNKYYEHITFIKDKLGIKPPIMTPQLEETLCNLFIDIQIPYAKYCPLDRVNFLNYYYTLYKLCELLDEKQYLPYFPMLKEQKKIEQDEVWKKICEDLDWDFIPTL
tara:strand:- start:167 stop:1234 length:1068 start_codon:yes stop_codon:yes gene_type:complete